MNKYFTSILQDFRLVVSLTSLAVSGLPSEGDFVTGLGQDSRGH